MKNSLKTVAQLNVFPIKSLRGSSLDHALITRRGFFEDRRWMLVDVDNQFLTQRKFPSLATMTVANLDLSLKVTHGTADTIEIPKQIISERFADVTVWKSVCRAKVYDDRINSWFSERLGADCKLVFMPEETRRSVNPLFRVYDDDHVSFADGYPFLLMGQSSLDDLNSRLESPLPMNRFRPNIVVEDLRAYEEDRWKRIRIGKTIFRAVKPSERCVVITVNQETGIKDLHEPLKTLATFRQHENKILFGQNLIVENAGDIISVGDEVEVLESLQDE